jgi:hypothetical protein
MSKYLKYIILSFVFIACINLTRRGLPPQEICQLDVFCKRQMKYHRQLLDEKSLFSSMQGTFHLFKRHKMVPLTLLGQIQSLTLNVN